MFWRFDKSHSVSECLLRTMGYGSALSPFLALRTIQQLDVDDRRKTFLRANDMYIDDILIGASTKENTIAFQKNIYPFLETMRF